MHMRGQCSRKVTLMILLVEGQAHIPDEEKALSPTVNNVRNGMGMYGPVQQA